MTNEERERIIGALSPGNRRLFDAAVLLCEEKGEFGGPDLHGPLPPNWRGRTDSPTRELDKLCALGLIRFAGRRENRGPNRKVYKITLLAEIEQAAAEHRDYMRRKAAKLDQGPRRNAAAQVRNRQREGEIHHYAVQERGVKPSATKWLRAAGRVVKLAGALEYVQPMLLWKNIVEDPERDRLAEALIDLQVWTELVLNTLREQRGFILRQEKIDSLRDTTGREPGEIPLYLAKADELQAELDAEMKDTTAA